MKTPQFWINCPNVHPFITVASSQPSWRFCHLSVPFVQVHWHANPEQFSVLLLCQPNWNVTDERPQSFWQIWIWLSITRFHRICPDLSNTVSWCFVTVCLCMYVWVCTCSGNDDESFFLFFFILECLLTLCLVGGQCVPVHVGYHCIIDSQYRC